MYSIRFHTDEMAVNYNSLLILIQVSESEIIGCIIHGIRYNPEANTDNDPSFVCNYSRVYESAVTITNANIEGECIEVVYVVCLISFIENYNPLALQSVKC